MASKSENFNETLDFSEEAKDALIDFSNKLGDINSRNLDVIEREKLIEELKSQLLIKICSLGENPEKISELIDELNLGKVINKFDDKNASPLMAYLQSSNGINVQEFITVLEKKGLNPNARNKEGNSALHLAIIYGLEQKVLKELLAHESVAINVKNNNGRTPLDLAVEGQNSLASKLLIDKGAQLGAFIVGEGSKPNQNAGRQLGGFEDKVRKYNEDIQDRIKEDFERNKELMEEIKQQKEADDINKLQMQRLEALKVQIELHHDLMKFFAKELAKQQKQEEWEEAQKSLEVNVKEGTESVADLDKIEGDKDANMFEIMGQKFDLSDKVTLNTLLHYYAMRGDLAATMALVRNGGDLNTTIGGRTVFEAAVDSGNNALFNQISIENPKVLNNLRPEYKFTVFSELVKDVNLDITKHIGEKDDSNLGRGGSNIFEKSTYVDRVKGVTDEDSKQETYVDRIKNKSSGESTSKDDIDVRRS